jgi:hypothetical protein
MLKPYLTVNPGSQLAQGILLRPTIKFVVLYERNIQDLEKKKLI